jgi:alginate O-acetyltransferase complex protein AlgI
MFFASYEFIFLFLPVALAGFFLLQQQKLAAAASCWLILVSLFFYWSLDERHVMQLVVSVIANYAIALGIQRYRSSGGRTAARLMWGGIAFNIGFLCWFKYGAFWLGDSAGVSIPLGLSFFAIQQIAFLISTCNGNDKTPPFHKYMLFVSFFPYVIAGPIVTKEEMFSQMDDMSVPRMRKMMLPALTLFALGLFKKVAFADNIGVYVDQVFDAAGHGTILSTADAWSAASLYTLQLYFDFSGYSDMAAGLAAMFGLQLPRNFHSPLKAHSIMEFWRRWHMSATRFFTNYLYLPLVLKIMRMVVPLRLTGVPQFLITVLIPMLLTFLLIGIWHGAGMTAVVFGLMMGGAIAVNHTWTKLGLPALPKWLGWMLTMLVVIVGMVFSRADDMAMADGILKAMTGMTAGAAPLLDIPAAVAWLAALGAIALFTPNTHEIMDNFPVVIKETWSAMPKWQERFKWQHGATGAAFASLVLCASAVLIPKAAQFIYYRF